MRSLALVTSHDDLTGVSAGDHHAEAHGAAHAEGAADELLLEALGSAGAANLAALSDGAGGVSMGAPPTIAHVASHAENAADEMLLEALGTARTVDELWIPDGSGGVTQSRRRIQLIRRTTDQSVTSSEVLVDDNTLLLPVDANTTYYVICGLLVESGATPDWKGGWTTPSSPLIDGFWKVRSAIASTYGSGNAWTAGSSFGSATWPLVFAIEGWYMNGANAGNLQLQFAQNTSDALATTHKIGSYLALIRIG